MASAIIDGTNIDTSVFSYSAPKANPSGGKVVNLYNKNFRESIYIRLNYLKKLSDRGDLANELKFSIHRKL